MVMMMSVLAERLRTTIVEVLYEEDGINDAEPSSEVGLHMSALAINTLQAGSTYLKRELISQETSYQVCQIA